MVTAAKTQKPADRPWVQKVVERKGENKDFAARLNQAVEGNPLVPPLNYGRLKWFVDELEKRGVSVRAEAVRKWFAAEARPRQKAMLAMAQILKVDEAWLTLGRSPVDERKKRLRVAEADGVVNVVAGFVQMCGGNPAFPLADDERAEREQIDLYAIIRGAQYAMHVVLSQEDKSGPVFLVPAQARDLLLLGVVRTSDLQCEFYDLGQPDAASLNGGMFKIKADDLTRFRRIDTFAERI